MSMGVRIPPRFTCAGGTAARGATGAGGTAGVTGGAGVVSPGSREGGNTVGGGDAAGAGAAGIAGARGGVAGGAGGATQGCGCAGLAAGGAGFGGGGDGGVSSMNCAHAPRGSDESTHASTIIRDRTSLLIRAPDVVGHARKSLHAPPARALTAAPIMSPTPSAREPSAVTRSAEAASAAPTAHS